MNKHITTVITILLLVCLFGCSVRQAQSTEPLPPPQETELPQVTPPPSSNLVPEETPAQPAETEEPSSLMDSTIYLTVSEINFSIGGESENIYVGTIPAEIITWESSDENIVTVENGVLTAAGVGTATVFAEYGSQKEEVKVSCLAENSEELELLDMSVLRSPKRMPPVIENPPLDFFDDAVMVGDSITHIMFGYENTNNMLGNVTFLTRGGSGINGFVRYYWNIYYRGAEMKLEEALALTGKNKVIFMLGQNDLGYRTVDQTFESWDILLERVITCCPDIEIYLQSCVPEWIDPSESNEKNEKIDEYNIRLKAYAEEHGYHFIDVAPYAEDHLNRMPDAYNLDGGIHLNEPGCVAWMNLLRAYAQWQE